MPRLLPRPPTATARGDSSAARLPDDLLDDQLKRFTAFALVSGGLWAIGLVMDAVVLPQFFGGRAPRAALIIEVTAIVLAVALYAWVRFSPATARVKSDAGLLLMLLNAAGIAMLETWATDPTMATIGHLSWTTIVILLSAMIVPSTPPKMLAAALTAASLGPLGVWLAHLRGVDVPPVAATLLMYMPSYSCALAAVIPARMLQRYGRRLREARDLGSYELEERLGSGGMGEVWRARHRLLARPAAIKLVRPEMLGIDPRLTQRRFASEAQATATLTSPYTIRLFDYGVTDDGRFYYVMELLDGISLQNLVSSFGPQPAGRVIHILKQMCRSLDEAHCRQLVHRDLKPSNVMLCQVALEFDVVKVLDFGLAKPTNRDESQLTADGISAGTPAYIAPEVALGERHVDGRADLYAMGCIAYYLLTGQLVFDEPSGVAMSIAHVQQPPVAPSLRSELPIPTELERIVLQLLEKKPAARPASAAVLAQMLDAVDDVEPWTTGRIHSWWHAHLPESSTLRTCDHAEQPTPAVVQVA